MSCGSVEGNYRPRRPQGEVWEYEPPKASLPVVPNPRNQAVDRAVLRMPDQHRAAVKMYYVDRRGPQAMCRALVLRWSGFSDWMFACRAMVLNLLRQAQFAIPEIGAYPPIDNLTTAKARLLPALEAVASPEET